MPIARVLLVDDDEVVRVTLSTLLEHDGFEVTTAASVAEALAFITTHPYDVLLSDLHMPGAGDGLTVVSAMKHANPLAVTLLLSSFPEMQAAAHALLMQADEILVKPVDVKSLVEVITRRMTGLPSAPRVVESVATILERTALSTIEDWFERVEQQDRIMAIPMSYEMRCGHLPSVFRDLVERLRTPGAIGSKELVSVEAAQHGLDRRRQGYSAAMMVDESRMLQVSIFQTLQNNLATISYSKLLIEVMTIADEVDSQLSQAMVSYAAESVEDALPA